MHTNAAETEKAETPEPKRVEFAAHIAGGNGRSSWEAVGRKHSDPPGVGEIGNGEGVNTVLDGGADDAQSRITFVDVPMRSSPLSEPPLSTLVSATPTVPGERASERASV